MSLAGIQIVLCLDSQPDLLDSRRRAGRLKRAGMTRRVQGLHVTLTCHTRSEGPKDPFGEGLLPPKAFLRKESLLLTLRSQWLRQDISPEGDSKMQRNLLSLRRQEFAPDTN
jgi:hypothetical protein